MVSSYTLKLGAAFGGMSGVKRVDIKEDSMAIEISCHGEKTHLIIPLRLARQFTKKGEVMNLFVLNEETLAGSKPLEIEEPKNERACIDI